MLRQALLSHSWPGNIRELENVMRQLLVLRRPELVAEKLRISAARRERATQMRGESASWRGIGSTIQLEDQPQPSTVLEDLGGRVPAKLIRQNHTDNGPNYEDVGQDQKPDNSVLREVDAARRRAESDVILSALNSTLWNRKRAAVLLSIDYKALLYKMRKLGIEEKARAVAF